MATGSLSLLDLAKLNGNDRVVGLIEENQNAAPEVLRFPVHQIRGTSYKTGVRTGFPDVGFRDANGGQSAGKSTFKQLLISCYIFGGNVVADEALAKGYEDGEEAFKMLEADGVMNAALLKLGRQIFDGTVSDSKGFPGLKSHTTYGGTTANGNALTINAGGSTANTASSCYLVRTGLKDVQMVAGNNSGFELGEWHKQLVAASDGSGNFMAHVAALTSWLGLQVGNEECVRRIANLTDDSGKGLTDALLAQAMATFPVGKQPNLIICNRFQASKLQRSRTVTLFGQGSTRPVGEAVAPFPTEYLGIPIIVTDSIGNTDAIES